MLEHFSANKGDSTNLVKSKKSTQMYEKIQTGRNLSL